ncbi:MAG: hypothetical protein ABFS02_02635 [Pseudomonadota bacterium]
MNVELTEIYNKAKAADVCDKALKTLEACETIDEALMHPDAPLWAASYAEKVIKGPWAPGEEAISKDASASFLYALFIIKGPWSKCEAVMINEAIDAYFYALHVIKGPWPPGEGVISKDAFWAYRYAVSVIKGPWPKGENAIRKDKQVACEYARIYAQWVKGQS